MKIVFIPGLGADERLFNALDLPNHELYFLTWKPPKNTTSLAEYATLFLGDLPDEPFVLIGVSMGGFMAMELSKISNPTKTILISSAKNETEIPFKIKLAYYSGAYRLFGGKSLKALSFRFKWMMGISGKDQGLFNEMLEQTSPDHLKWSVRAILRWRNDFIPKNLIHIHGDKDWTLPIQKVKADHIIEGGTHYMIFDRGEEISTLLNKIVA